jgi:hypothetical protein
MGTVAFVVERRLVKMLRRRARDEAKPIEEDVELSVSPEQVQE